MSDVKSVLDPLSPYYDHSELTSQDLEDAESDTESDSLSHASIMRTPSPNHDSDLTKFKFGPTVPRAQSGSPKKPVDAPLDPQCPQAGMMFGTLEEAVHFVYEYEHRRGYIWKKGESERSKQPQGMCLVSFSGVGMLIHQQGKSNVSVYDAPAHLSDAPSIKNI